MEVVENQSIATVGAQKNMKMTDEEIAMYKIAKAMETIDYIRNSENFLKLFESVWKIEMAPVDKWKNIVQPLMSTLKISIRKPTERPESFDDMSGSEYNRRLQQWSCHNPLCKERNHCTECDKCKHRKHDGHLCRCPVCGLEYISSADGKEHNMDGECKESSE